jgi:two-component system LytT family response regulator
MRRAGTAALAESGARWRRAMDASSEEGEGEGEGGARKSLAIRVGRHTAHIRVDAIDWFEAGSYFVKLHIGFETHLLREKIGALEERLDAERFVRIHRSVLVNVDRVREVQTRPDGAHLAVLRDGTVLQVSRSRVRALEARMRAAGTLPAAAVTASGTA